MHRPRFKASHRPQIRTDGTVWFGPWVPGMAVELDDETGVLRALCERLDGSRTAEELLAEVAALFPGETDVDEVAEVLDYLIESGWVQDAAAVPPPELTERDLDRYSRTIEYFDTVNLRRDTDGYRMQAKLKASRVTVLGVGGGGSALAHNLVATGVGHVHCVDHDTVELSNLTRQILYSESDLGQRKLDVAVRRLRDQNSDVRVTGQDVRIDGEAAIAGAVAGSDVFVLCADQPRAEIGRWANAVAYRLGIPFLISGYLGPEISLATFIPGRTACSECLAAGSVAAMTAKGLPTSGTGEKKLYPVIATGAAMVGHYLALETIHLLLGMRVQTAGRLLQRYLIDYDQHNYVDARPRPDCPVGCGAMMPDAAGGAGVPHPATGLVTT